MFDHGNSSKNSIQWVVYHVVRKHPENLLSKIHNYVILSCQNSGFIVLRLIYFILIFFFFFYNIYLYYFDIKLLLLLLLFNSNIIFSQSGNDKIFTFVKSVIDYCNSKCSNQVVDSFVDLVEVYNNELKLNTSQMIGKIIKRTITIIMNIMSY